MRKLLYIAAVVWLLVTGYHAGLNACKKECIDKQIDSYKTGYERCLNTYEKN